MTPLQSFLKIQLLGAHLYEQPITKEEKGWLKEHLAPALKFMQDHKFTKRDQKLLVTTVNHIAQDADFESVAPSLKDLATAVRDKLPRLNKDTSISSAELKLLRDMVLVNRRGSESAWTRVNKSVGQLRDPTLSKRFQAESDSPDQYKEEVRKAVKRLTGKPADSLTAEQIKEYRESKPEQYKVYLKAVGALRKVGADAQRAFVRSSGKHLIDVDTARKHLDSNGYAHLIPKGFVGQIDENGHLYTKFGELIKGAPGSEVKMNPGYTKGSLEHVFVSKPRFGETEQYAFTMHAKSEAAKRKAEKVEQLSSNIDSIRAKWLKDLDSKNPKLKTMAAMLETIYQTSARVGNAGSQKAGIKTSEPRFGLTTLKSKHIKVDPSKAIFSYLGKSAQRQRHVLPADDATAKKVLKIMADLKEGKKPNDDLWTVGRSRVKGGALNKYFQHLGSPTTVHKLRHAKGNQILTDELKSKPKTKDEKRINNFLFKALTKVGKQLGHFNKGKVTPGTALSAYVTPGIVSKYYQSYGVRPPAKVQRVLDVAEGRSGLRSSAEEHQVEQPKTKIRKAKLNQSTAVRPARLGGKVPPWFARKTGAEQREYLKMHPKSHLKVTKI